MKSKTILTAFALLAATTITGFAQEDGGARRERRGGGQLPPEVLKEFDKDGDGKLNDEERKAMQEAGHKKLLEKFDTDKDGKLSDEERKAIPQRPKGDRGPKGDKKGDKQPE